MKPADGYTQHVNCMKLVQSITKERRRQTPG